MFAMRLAAYCSSTSALLSGARANRVHGASLCHRTASRRALYVRRKPYQHKSLFSGLRMAAIDYRQLEQNIESVELNIRNRNATADARRVAALYKQFCALTFNAGELRKLRNENAALMKRAAQMSAEERSSAVAEGKRIKQQIADLEAELAAVEEEMEREAAKIPNATHPDVPIGEESNATVLEVRGAPRDFAKEGFEPRDHVAVGEALDLFDFDAAARISGAKFYFLRNAAALLEVALVNWALNECVKQGFTPMTAPDLAREAVVSGCGFNPRGEGSQVYTLSDSDLCLVGTAEIPLGGYFADQLLEKSALPVRMAAVSHCFRQEAGAAGAATRGLYRVHQFTKVEMFVLCAPEDSETEHAQLRAIEQRLFDALGLHYKVLDMPTHDLGAPAYRKLDIEAWMPGRGAFGEISSASNCTDFQARRLNIRYREKLKDNRYVHTLNGTACAVPRMILAILENFQNSDGSVTIPEVLRPYMGGMDIIRAPSVATAAVK